MNRNVVFATMCSVAALTFVATAVAPSAGYAQTVLSTYTVEFALGSATLDAEARRVVQEAAASFESGDSATMRVVGRTDTTGSAEFNQRLSERRAQAVGEALVAAGVPADAIRLNAVGQTDLIVPTADNVAEQANRVVTVDVVGPSAPPVAAVAAPAVVAAALPRLQLGAGGYYGFDLGPDQHFAGANFSADYFITEAISVGAEQAVFYNFGRDATDSGIGGRSVGSVDYHLGLGAIGTHIGANAGYIYGSGVESDFIYGPEIGLTWDFLQAKVAWDIRDAGLDESIISATLGAAWRF